MTSSPTSLTSFPFDVAARMAERITLQGRNAHHPVGFIHEAGKLILRVRVGCPWDHLALRTDVPLEDQAAVHVDTRALAQAVRAYGRKLEVTQTLGGEISLCGKHGSVLLRRCREQPGLFPFADSLEGPAFTITKADAVAALAASDAVLLKRDHNVGMWFDRGPGADQFYTLSTDGWRLQRHAVPYEGQYWIPARVTFSAQTVRWLLWILRQTPATEISFTRVDEWRCRIDAGPLTAMICLVQQATPDHREVIREALTADRRGMLVDRVELRHTLSRVKRLLPPPHHDIKLRFEENRLAILFTNGRCDLEGAIEIKGSGWNGEPQIVGYNTRALLDACRTGPKETEIYLSPGKALKDAGVAYGPKAGPDRFLALFMPLNIP